MRSIQLFISEILEVNVAKQCFMIISKSVETVIIAIARAVAAAAAWILHGSPGCD